MTENRSRLNPNAKRSLRDKIIKGKNNHLSQVAFHRP
jgi:hypothetical protein